MVPAFLNKTDEIGIQNKKTFAETLCDAYHFELKQDINSIGTRSIFYYKSEHSLLVSHVLSNRVHILNLVTGKLRWFDHHGATVRKVLVCNHEIITASWDGTVCVASFDSLNLRLTLTEKRMGRCPSVVISPNSEYAYSYSYDSDKSPLQTANTVRKWSLADGKLKETIQLPGYHLSRQRCGSCEVYDNRLYIVSDSGQLQIYNCTTGILLKEDFYYDRLQSLRLIPALNMLAVGGSEGNIYLCDLSGERILQKRKVHRHDITHLHVLPDKPEIMISISFDGNLKILKLPDLEILNSTDVNRDRLWTVTVVNNLLVTGGENGDIWIYDIKNLPDVVLKGRLIISNESYAYLSSESNSFYASDLSMIQVCPNDDTTATDAQLADYILNTTCNFSILKDLFCSERDVLSKLQIDTKGYYQLTQ